MSDWKVFVTFEESDIGQKTRRRTPGCQTGKFPPLYREVRPPPLLSTVTWGEDNFNIFVIHQQILLKFSFLSFFVVKIHLTSSLPPSIVNPWSGFEK